jgi:hypothetical protein
VTLSQSPLSIRREARLKREAAEAAEREKVRPIIEANAREGERRRWQEELEARAAQRRLEDAHQAALDAELEWHRLRAVAWFPGGSHE